MLKKLRNMQVTDIANKFVFSLSDRYRVLNMFLLILFFFYFEITYTYIIIVDYARDGYADSFNLFKFVETKVLFLAALILLNLRSLPGFVYGISSLLMVFYFIPNLVIYEFMDGPRLIPYSIFYTLALVILIGCWRPELRPSRVKPGLRSVFLILLAGLFLTPVIMKLGSNLNVNLLFLRDVYETRAEAAAQMTRFFDYAMMWVSKIILPLLIVVGLMRRSVITILIAIAGLFFLYLITGHKSFFIGVFAVLFLYAYKDYSKKVSFFLLVFFLILLLARFSALTELSLFPESLTLRRTLFDPALGNLYYFDYFGDKSLYLSHSILRSFVEFPLSDQPEAIISADYFNYPDGSSNNGLVSDAYMNFGVPGLIVFPVLFALVIWFFSVIRIHARFFGVFLIVTFTFISSFFLTTLLTHGVIILALLSLIFLSGTENQAERAHWRGWKVFAF